MHTPLCIILFLAEAKIQNTAPVLMLFKKIKMMSLFVTKRFGRGGGGGAEVSL